jgi:Domain of unknown function (DUF1844)
VFEENEGKVRVVDRRRFTADGDAIEQEAAPQPAPSPRADERPAAAPPAAEPAAHEPPSSPSTAGFLDLVDFLAQQAAAFLSGQVPGRGRDPQTARFFIDLLAVVHDKTAGQLSSEEARYLEDVLFQLRSLFVGATR